MAIDWPTVVTTILGSGVVAAGVTQGITTLREGAKHKAEAQAAAQSCAIALEQFGAGCAELVVNLVKFRDSGGALGVVSTNLPTTSALRANVDLSLLPLSVASTLLQFEAAAARASVDLQDTFADDPLELALSICLRLGESSFDSAAQIRKKMTLPSDPSQDLNQRRAYLSEQRERSSGDIGPTCSAH